MINSQYQRTHNTNFKGLTYPKGLPGYTKKYINEELGELGQRMDIKVKKGSDYLRDLVSPDGELAETLKIKVSPLKQTPKEKILHFFGFTPEVKFEVFNINIGFGNLKKHTEAIMESFFQKKEAIEKAEPKLDKAIAESRAAEVITDHNKATVYLPRVSGVAVNF